MNDLSAQEQKRHLKALLESEGWRILRGVLEEQVHNRTESIILVPLEGADAVYGQEYAKGEIAGLRLALATPATLFDEVAKLAQEQQQENDDDDDPDTDPGDFDPEAGSDE